MVTIAPQRQDTGSALGAAVGQGLQKGISTGMEQGVNRSRLQSALQEAKLTADDPNASYTDKANAYLSAFAGIPGSERYVGQILPLILQQHRAEQSYGQGGGQTGQGSRGLPNVQFGGFGPGGMEQGGQPGQQPGQQQQPFVGSTRASGEPSPGISASQLTPGLPKQGEPTSAGYLPHVRSVSEIDSIAKDYALINSNNPNAYGMRQGELLTENKLAEEHRNAVKSLFREQGVTNEDMPDAMMQAERYGWMPNRDELVKNAFRDFEQARNYKATLESAFIPGFFKGLITSPKERETTLSRLTPTVQDLVKIGEENKVRTYLKGKSLSDTEIEEQIHPLSPKTKQMLRFVTPGKFPEDKFAGYEHIIPGLAKSNKTYDQVYKDNPNEIQRQNSVLANNLKSMVGQSDSLLVLRDKLYNDLNYDWRQIGPAFREAMTGKDALELTTAQKDELTKVETQPPIQSLSNVFLDAKRWMDYIAGRK